MSIPIKFITVVVAILAIHKIFTRQTKTATPTDTPKTRPHPWHIRPYVQTTTSEYVEVPWSEQEAQPDVPVTKKRKRGRPPKKVSEKAPETNKQVSEKNKRAKDIAYQSGRADALRAMLAKDPNYTLEELGKHFGVSRERIRQLLVLHKIEKGYGQRNRRSYAIATFEDKVLVGIGTPNRNDPEIPRDIFDPASPNFAGVETSKINTISVYIRTPSSPESQFTSVDKRHEHIRLNFRDPYKAIYWRCYTCKPLYAWGYIQETGKVGKESETKPCNNCGKPVTKRAAILDRIRENPQYHGNFYCNRKCFYEWQNYKSPTKWYATSPIYQGAHSEKRQITCVVCNTEFETTSIKAKLCSPECKKIRMEQRRKEKQLSSSRIKSNPTIRVIKELGTYGLRLPYIAERLNVSEATVAQWSSGGYEPPNPKETLQQLKRLLQMTKRLS